jgi:hypothetical protein
LIVFVVCSVASASAQTGTPATAATILNQAYAALSSGTTVADLTASGTIVWIIGDQQSGSATLRVKGALESRIDLTLGSTVRTEIRNDTSGPDGEWITPDGIAHRMPLHDLWTASAWYSPYSVVASMLGSNLNLTYIASEIQNNLAVDHLRVARSSIAGAPGTILTSHLSAIDLYLDQTSHLPWSIQFVGHPDDNASVDIPIEIRFANYQSVNGVLFPFRIQRLVGNVLNLDLTVTNVAINTNLPDTVFTLQ